MRLSVSEGSFPNPNHLDRGSGCFKIMVSYRMTGLFPVKNPTKQHSGMGREIRNTLIGS